MNTMVGHVSMVCLLTLVNMTGVLMVMEEPMDVERAMEDIMALVLVTVMLIVFGAGNGRDNGRGEGSGRHNNFGTDGNKS